MSDITDLKIIFVRQSKFIDKTLEFFVAIKTYVVPLIRLRIPLINFDRPTRIIFRFVFGTIFKYFNKSVHSVHQRTCIFVIGYIQNIII